jgi:hypothetical protein
MGDSLILKAFVICKKEPSSCFSCKTDTLVVVLFLQNRGNKLFLTTLYQFDLVPYDTNVRSCFVNMERKQPKLIFR